MKALPVFLTLLFLSASNTQTKFKANLDEAEEAASSYETTIFSLIPRAKPYISYFDIDTDDGHLLVWIEKTMLSVEKRKQTEIYRNLLDVWKLTKWVKQKHYAGYLEVLYLDSSTGKTRTIRFVR
jgi:hypothetical protein